MSFPAVIHGKAFLIVYLEFFSIPGLDLPCEGDYNKE